MSPRKQPHRRIWLRPRVLTAFIAMALLGFAAHALKGPVGKILSPRPRPDVGALNSAIEEAYSRIGPERISTSTVSLDGRQVRQDHLELSRNNSLLRANLEITRAVEKAGGDIPYGIDSSDKRRRRQIVTLGISDGDSLIREIRLEKRFR